MHETKENRGLTNWTILDASINGTSQEYDAISSNSQEYDAIPRLYKASTKSFLGSSTLEIPALTTHFVELCLL